MIVTLSSRTVSFIADCETVLLTVINQYCEIYANLFVLIILYTHSEIIQSKTRNLCFRPLRAFSLKKMKCFRAMQTSEI